MPKRCQARPVVERLEDRVVPVLFAYADLQMLSLAATGSVVAGAKDSIVATVKNNGPTTAFSMKLSETFGSGLTGVTFTPSSGSYNSSTGNWTGFSLPVGKSITLTATGLLNDAATGTLSVHATVAPPTVSPGLVDPNPSNNSLSKNFSISQVADLEVLQGDNSSPAGSAIPGTTITYTVLVFSNGPSVANNAVVKDTFPASIDSPTWTAAVHSGASVAASSGSGNINTTVDLVPGSFVVFTITAPIDPSATGSVVNTATIAAPSGVTDPNLKNNTASDTLTLKPASDMAIIKFDNVGGTFNPTTNNTTGGTIVPGQDNTVTYTIEVGNFGLSTAVKQSVTDSDLTSIPGLVSESWSAVATSGSSIVTGSSGTGNIASTVTLLPDGIATYTVTAVIDPDPSATGTISNTATVAVPTGDTTPNDNTAKDTLTLAPRSDLSIAKTDNVGGTFNATSNNTSGGTIVPGQDNDVTFTIVVTNNGPSTAVGQTVTDSDLTSITGLVSESWSAVASSGSSIVTGSSGTGTNIASTVTLLPGGTATYTVLAVIHPDPAATAAISNTATVAVPTGDTTPANNTSTDTLTLPPQANLTISKTDNVNNTLSSDETVTYTITISNSGPSSVSGVSVSDVLPAGLTFVSGDTGVNFNSGTGTVSFTTGAIAANSGMVSFNFIVTTPATITGAITNTATLTPPSGVTDTNATTSAMDTLTPPP